MVSSTLSPTKPSHEEAHEAQSSGGNSSGGNGNDKGKTGETKIYLTVFIFRGMPIDTWDKRHVLLYLTSPDLPDFHKTIHTQRDERTSLWVVDRVHQAVEWIEEVAYLSHVNAGVLSVQAGQEMLPMDIIAAVGGGERPDDWNCQNFLYEGFQALVHRGFQTQEWCDAVVGEMMDKLLEDAVG
jgi:hypothetical protein